MQEGLQRALGERFDAQLFGKFAARFSYVAGDLNDSETFRRLYTELGKPKTGVCSNMVFYLAIKPSEFAAVAKNLDAVGLNRPRGLHRIVIEKPFGEDLQSAQQLNQLLHEYFQESQIFRIDHYLGKETVQNLIVFRFANLLIEPLWNRTLIDSVQITAAETAGISGRADYYDKFGALRDMVQNHLMQLLTLTAMEPPAALEPDALRDEKVKVLRSIRAISPAAIQTQVVRAQYANGVIDGQPVPGYAQEPGVQHGSRTETYAAVKLFIDNWRWRGVPFFLRTGKRLASQQSHIAIRFKHTPQQLFREMRTEELAPNWILLSLQPEERMVLEIQARQPGLGMNARTVQMNAQYHSDGQRSIEAYEALLLDIMRGDPTHFIRFDEVEWAWRVVDPILQAWAKDQAATLTYPAGSWGPAECEQLFEWGERRWRNDVSLDAGR
jgi:glucose-6-phosphate 1-dehydrogenase